MDVSCCSSHASWLVTSVQPFGTANRVILEFFGPTSAQVKAVRGRSAADGEKLQHVTGLVSTASTKRWRELITLSPIIMEVENGYI